MGKLRYTPAEVVMGFGGAVTFSPEAARAVADAITDAGELGSMTPDDAARAVQAAVFTATGESDGRGGIRNGLPVSIDTSLAALTAIHASKGAAGAVVGFEDQAGAARGSSGGTGGGSAGATGSGTAAAAGAASQGAGAAAGDDDGGDASSSNGGGLADYQELRRQAKERGLNVGAHPTRDELERALASK